MKSRESGTIGILERNQRHQPVLHELFAGVLAQLNFCTRLKYRLAVFFVHMDRQAVDVLNKRVANIPAILAIALCKKQCNGKARIRPYVTVMKRCVSKLLKRKGFQRLSVLAIRQPCGKSRYRQPKILRLSLTSSRSPQLSFVRIACNIPFLRIRMIAERRYTKNLRPHMRNERCVRGHSDL